MESNARKLDEVSHDFTKEYHTPESTSNKKYYDALKASSLTVADTTTPYFHDIKYRLDNSKKRNSRILTDQKILERAQKQQLCSSYADFVNIGYGQGINEIKSLKTVRCNSYFSCRVCAHVKSIKRSNDFDQKRKQLIEQVRMNPSDNLEGRELQNFTKDPVLTYVLTLSPRNFGTIEEGLIFFKKGFAKLDKAINTKADRCGNKLAKYALSQLKEGFLGSMRKIEVEHSLSEDGKLNIHSHLVLLMKNAGVDKYTLDFKSFYQLVSWAFGENMQVHFGTKRNEQTGDNSHRPLRCGKETSKAVYEVCKYITKMPTAGKESPEEIEAQQALIWETTALASKYKLFQLTGRIAKVKIKKETKLDMRRPKSAFHQDLTNHDGDTGYSQYTYPVKKNLLKPAIFERLQIKDLLKDLKHSHESRLDMINRGEYSAKSLKKKDARIKGLETRKANLEQIISDTEEAIQARNEATKATFVHVSYNNQDKNDSGVSETPESIAQNKQKLDDLVKLCEGNTSDPNELPL